MPYTREDFDPQDLIIIDTEEGDIECGIIGSFDADGKEYIALMPFDGTDEAYLYRCERRIGGYDIVDIESDTEYAVAASEYMRLCLFEE